MAFEIVKFGVVFLFYLSPMLFNIVNCKGISKRSVDCAENEMYVDCGKCGAKTCGDLGFPQPCAGSSKRYCKAGCVCIDGFVKNDNGTCIWNKDCPSCGGDPNAESGCGNHCGNSCSDYMEKDKLCLSGCRFNSCKCRNGFVFDEETGKCVSPGDCPPRPQNCKQYEIWTECAVTCPPQTCASIFTDYICTDSTPCKPGCKCQDGYLRDGDNGPCILADQCPTSIEPVCPENEEYTDCPPVCPPQTCASIYSLYNCDDAPACQPGCQCKNGYLRDGDNGTCVLSEQCPPPILTCGENEEFIENNTRCEENCPVAVENAEDIGVSPPARNCSAFSGCYCMEGFVRDQNFSCVPDNQCPTPQVCDGDYEFLNTCWSACATNCKTRFRGDGQICPAVCLTGCSCEVGFLRHDNGTCVPVEECSPPICNDDEQYKVASTPCEQDCDNFNNTCLACIQVVQEGCFCKENTIRAGPDNLTCIAPENCPPKQCPENEHYEYCPPECPPETCSAIWSRYACNNQTDCCEPKCRCNEGYYRNDADVCITTQQCINTRGAT